MHRPCQESFAQAIPCPAGGCQGWSLRSGPTLSRNRHGRMLPAGDAWSDAPVQQKQCPNENERGDRQCELRRERCRFVLFLCASVRSFHVMKMAIGKEAEKGRQPAREAVRPCESVTGSQSWLGRRRAGSRQLLPMATYHRTSRDPWLSKGPGEGCSVRFPGAAVVCAHLCPLVPSVTEKLPAPSDAGRTSSKV